MTAFNKRKVLIFIEYAILINIIVKGAILNELSTIDISNLTFKTIKMLTFIFHLTAVISLIVLKKFNKLCFYSYINLMS